MMDKHREIRFRAWEKERGHMIYPNPHMSLDFNGRVCNFQNGMGGDDYIIMEYTGLKDKNGKEIYEGDILRVGLGETVYYTDIKWSGNGFWIDNPLGGEHLPYGEYLEIVGNIYENPGLLDKEG